MNLKSLQSVAESYIAMLTGKPAAPASRPKWVPTSITEENVTAFVQAVTEAANSKKASFEFNGKKYGIKSIKEETSEEDQGQAKKIQDAEVENAPKQPSDEVPAEVKEEDAEEIKMDNHDEKEVKADEMPKLDDDKVEEELVGNQHKLDVNKNGKVDGDDLKKLRSEEKEEDSDEKDAEPDADGMDEPSDNDADKKGEDEKEEEKPKMTGEQVMASLAATYASMVNENVAGDPHAANLSAKANSATALAHTSHSETHHEDARDAHNLAAEHYRVYAHNHHDPLVRSAANIHHEFHRSMSNHHMLNLVSSDMDKEAHDMAAKHYGKKSVEEGTAADAEAGPEVMDPATQKMKDDADDETEVVDMLPTAAQDGADKLDSAKKPAAANSSAALPKVAIVDAPVTTNESTDSLEEQQDGTFYDGSDMLGEAQARYSDSYKFTHKPGDTESEKKLADLKAATKGSGNRVVLQGRLGKNNPNANKYSVKAGGGKSGGPVGRPPGQSGPHSHQRIAKADAAHHDVYVYRKA